MVIRRRVTANEVLLKTAASIEKVEATLLMRPILARLAGSTSTRGLPTPRETVALVAPTETMRKTLWWVCY